MALTELERDITSPSAMLAPRQSNFMSKYDFTHKFAPDVIPDVARLYNNGVTGFCETFGKEREMTSDRIYCGESGRRLKVESGVSLVVATGVFTCADNTIQREGAKILVADPANGKLQLGRVIAVDPNNGKNFTAQPYDGGTWTVGSSALNVITVGSEFLKGSEAMLRAIYSQLSIYSTSLTISKDTFVMPGSDVSNATWLYAPDGTPFWFNSETEEALARFKDYEELNCLTSVQISESSPLFTQGYNSTDGLFNSIRKRGNSFAGIPTAKADWESIIKRLDKVSGERYNSLFIDTETSLKIDDMIASENKAMLTPGWGIFENKERAVDFGFDAFRMGGYEFYKQTWKVLNDPTALAAENLGAANAIHGIMMPMGAINVTTGYTGELSGGNAESLNYLTRLYKKGRRLITTPYGNTTGNGRQDVMGFDWTSETGLLLVGAIKWAIFEGEAA